MTAINEYSIMEAAALMAAGKLTAVALAEHCLARVAAREKDVEAWAYIDRDHVMAQAMACDRESRRSPLHGIPVGVKDIIDTAGMPTEYGSPIYAGYRPRSDAACVAILKNAGAIIMGKTVTAEFAMRQPGKTRNPHNAAHTPGGSSSGSAAAVADFMVPLALGTQTGGSIIRPAAFCGTFGFKPTFNIINRAGVKPAAESLDTVGFFARSLPDVTIALSVMTGNEIAELSPFERNKPRLAFCRTPQWQHADHWTVQALEDAVTALAQAGAHIRELQLPPQFDAVLQAQGATSDYESVRALAYERRTYPQQLSTTLARKLEEAERCTLSQYLRARHIVGECRNLLPSLFSEFDALLVPSAKGEAPKDLKTTGDAIFNRIWTALHVPAVTLPVFTGPNGLPMGLQLIAHLGCDYKLLQCAEWVSDAIKRR